MEELYGLSRIGVGDLRDLAHRMVRLIISGLSPRMWWLAVAGEIGDSSMLWAWDMHGHCGDY